MASLIGMEGFPSICFDVFTHSSSSVKGSWSQSFPFSLSVLGCASQYVSWSHTALGAFLLVKERSYPGLRSVSQQQKEKTGEVLMGTGQ